MYHRHYHASLPTQAIATIHAITPAVTFVIPRRHTHRLAAPFVFIEDTFVYLRLHYAILRHISIQLFIISSWYTSRYHCFCLPHCAVCRRITFALLRHRNIADIFTTLRILRHYAITFSTLLRLIINMSTLIFYYAYFITVLRLRLLLLNIIFDATDITICTVIYSFIIITSISFSPSLTTVISLLHINNAGSRHYCQYLHILPWWFYYTVITLASRRRLVIMPLSFHCQ